MLPDDDKDFIVLNESISFAFTVALAGFVITLILAWVGA